MWRRVLIRAVAVAGLSIVSIVAFANSFPDKGPVVTTGSSTEEMQIEVETTEVPATTAEISAEPMAPVTLEPEPTEEPAEQSMIISMDWGAEDSYLLAKIAMAEAESEDTEGKALVILVVLNRVWSDGFPNSIEDVIYQSGQFSPISNGRFDRVEPDADCWAALDLIMLDKWDESCGATYFESESESSWHSENLDYLFQHGNHYFYKDRE